MKDIDGVIRTAIYSALNGNLSYNSINVPIFDEAPTQAQTAPYLILSTQTDTNTSNNARNVHEGDILLDIVTIQSAFVNKEIAETISNQIQAIIQPTVTGNGLTLAGSYTLTYIRRESSNYLPMLQSDTAKILRKIIRYQFRIQEN